MSKRRVFITGFGSVSMIETSAQGTGFYDALLDESVWPKHCNCKSSVRSVAHFNGEEYLPPDQLRRMDRFSQMALVATRKSIREARLELTPAIAERLGIIFNTCFGPLQTTETYVTKLIREGPKKAPAGIFPYTVQNAFTGLITMDVKALGTNSTVSACSSVCYGFDTIRQDTDDVMIVGGCEEITPSLVSGFGLNCGSGDHQATEGHATEESEGRDTTEFTLGEGAGAILLEEEDFATSREANLRAEILHYGMANNLPRGTHPYSANSIFIENAMRSALDNSGISPEDIQLFIPSENGTASLVQAEWEAFGRVFGPSNHPRILPVKNVIGETLGASAIFSVMAAASALERQVLPDWIEGSNGDNAREKSSPFELEHALVNCYELGGNINSIVMKRAQKSVQ